VLGVVAKVKAILMVRKVPRICLALAVGGLFQYMLCAEAWGLCRSSLLLGVGRYVVFVP
jgi:hypothetical protein